MIRAVLFDLGHTLMDFAPTQDALRMAYQTVRERLTTWVEDRAPPEVDELVERIAGAIDVMVGRSYEERRLEELDQIKMFDTAFRGLGYELPRELLEEVAEIDHDAVSASWKAGDDTIATLARLRADGFALGLVSNFSLLPHRLHGDLERAGIREHLGAVAFSSEVGVRKPHARIFLTALETLGIPPAEAVHVGDRLADDVYGAHALGIRTILTRQYRFEEPDRIRPDAIVSRLSEVPAVIEGWQRGYVGP
ncbi:MAG TPA: HAD family hydrolase [Actinomycetota bacterium]